MENDYVCTGLATNVPVPDYFTDNNYSLSVGCQRTNEISSTSHPYDPSSTGLHSWMLPINTIPSNEHNMYSKFKPIEGLQKTSSISNVIDDHPYRPDFSTELFGVLTENQKQSRKLLTSLLSEEKTNNLLQMTKDQPIFVSLYFLPSPNQLNKSKANLNKDATIYMRSTSNQRHSYEQVTNTKSAELLLHMNRGRSVPKSNFTPA